MKKIFSILISLSIFFISVNLCHSATTSDGLITLDFFEDTSHGSPNIWQLDFTVNDIGGGIESILFSMEFFNGVINFENPLNPASEFYEFSAISSGTIPIIFTPVISSKTVDNPVPVETTFNFFSQSEFSGIPIIDDFYVDVHYMDNLGQQKQEWVELHGIAGFIVPEPISVSLFSFGALLLYLMSRKKNS